MRRRNSITVMKPPSPIIVSGLFEPTLNSLLDLLSGLTSADWNKATACTRWSVKDIASHLLSGEIGILSRKRDHYAYSGNSSMSWEELVALINNLNDVWIKATSRMSPRILCELMKLTGEQA